MNIFSENLKKLRNSRSQKDFAEFLGISSQQTYANYEKGRIPKNNKLQQIAERCGVNIDWLLTGEGTKKVSAETTLEENEAIYMVNTQDYKGAFEAIVKMIPRDELYNKIRLLIDKAQQGDKNAIVAAKEAFELISKEELKTKQTKNKPNS